MCSQCTDHNNGQEPLFGMHNGVESLSRIPEHPCSWLALATLPKSTTSDAHFCQLLLLAFQRSDLQASHANAPSSWSLLLSCTGMCIHTAKDSPSAPGGPHVTFFWTLTLAGCCLRVRYLMVAAAEASKAKAPAASMKRLMMSTSFTALAATTYISSIEKQIPPQG